MLPRGSRRGLERGRPVRTVPHAALEPDRRGGPASSRVIQASGVPAGDARRLTPDGATAASGDDRLSPRRQLVAGARHLGAARARACAAPGAWHDRCPGSSPMSPTASEPIVLVDDDPEMRAMLRDFLAGAGFRV